MESELSALADFIIIDIIDGILVPLLFSVAFLVFLWGVYNFFIVGGNNEEKRKEGRTFVIYGVIGFFVMIGVWGIVNVLVNTFGFNTANRPTLPQFDSFTPQQNFQAEPLESAGNSELQQRNIIAPQFPAQ